MHEKTDDKNAGALALLPEEPLTITFVVAELTPGTFAFLDDEDGVLATGTLDDEFFDEDDEVTEPNGRTIIGPLMDPRLPAAPADPGLSLILNDTDDGDRTIHGPPPAPGRKR